MAMEKTMPLILSIFLATGFVLHTEELRAQEFEFKGEIFGKIVGGWTAEDEGGLGRGFVFGGGVGYMLSNRWEIAAEIQNQRNRLERGPGEFFHEGQSLKTGGNFQYHFSKSRLQPCPLLGLSYARFDGAKGFRAYDENPEIRTEGKQNFFGVDLGFGCKIFVSEHVSINPEARLYLGGSGSYEPGRDPVEPGLILTSFNMGLGYH